MPYFRVPPQGLRVKPSPVRRVVRGRLGDIPAPDGGPGNLVSPYDESRVWGEASQGGMSTVVTNPPDVGAVGPGPATPYVSPSIPYGESDRPWYNPTTYSSIPISVDFGNTGAAKLALNLNFQRNALIIQNLSFVTVAADVNFTLYVGFNSQPQVGQCLSLAPGLGFYWGASDPPPRDSIFCLFAPPAGSNAVGASAIPTGVIVQGTYTPPPTS